MSPASLSEIEAACWAGLAEAAADPKHAWRLMALATVDGDAADARTVVLRECLPVDKMLVVYTDARSPKVTQIDAHPVGTLLAWSRALSWQLRLRCRLTVESSGAGVEARWLRLKATPSAQDYLSPATPGAPLESAAAPLEVEGHFAMLNARVERIDWLELRDGAHRRALFDDSGARWVIP